jgi:hypothetical protein
MGQVRRLIPDFGFPAPPACAQLLRRRACPQLAKSNCPILKAC